MKKRNFVKKFNQFADNVAKDVLTGRGEKVKSKNRKLPIGYKKNLPSNLQRQFTPRQQNPILIMKKLVEQNKSQMRTIETLMRRNIELKKQMSVKPFNRGQGATPPPKRIITKPSPIQQFRKPQPRGLWARDPTRENNSFYSRMPRSESTQRIWRGRRPTFFLEGDILGNVVQKVGGVPEAFFN